MTSNLSSPAPTRIELPVEFVEELWPASVMSETGLARTAVSRRPSHVSTAARDMLNSAFMFLSGLARRKRAKIFPAA